MRILVPLKQVPDPDHVARCPIRGDESGLDLSSIEPRMNPFDEYALETALRLTEDGRNPRQRCGEVIAITLGPKAAETMLRAALATGADRAIHIECQDHELDGTVVAHALRALVGQLEPELVLLGKQTVDGDGGEVAQRLAGLLDWPQATFASKIHEHAEHQLRLEREVDGGLERLELTLPAIVSVELRVVAPEQVHSRHTPSDHRYPPGVRFASLPSILQSKRKPLEKRELRELVGERAPRVKYVRYLAPSPRAPGRRVGSPDELVHLLRTEAKLL